jgi:phage tail sheath gpL-like
MPVSFERVPAHIRTPLFYAEFSSSLAGYYAQAQPSCLIGPMLDDAPVAVAGMQDKPVRISSYSEAVEQFGIGSVLADMVRTYRMNDSFGELWCVPVLAAGGAAATGQIEVTGTATAAGMISLYIGGELVRVAVNRNAANTDIADAIAAAITTAVGGMISAVHAGAGAVNVTAHQPGELGNEIGIELNYRGEALPPGVEIDIIPMSGGAGVADLRLALESLGDETYDFVGLAYSDVASLDAAEDAFNDITGRWAWDRQSYGHVWCARMGSANDLATFGRARNDPHMCLVGYPVSATPSWRMCAAFLAQAASSLRIDPARPLQTLPLAGTMPPQRQNVFTKQQLDMLLNNGVAPANPVPPLQEFQIIRSITTYQRNRWAQPDPSWLDVQTPVTLTYFVRFMRGRILQKFPRHKLASDGAVFGPGQAVVTPRIIRAELLAAYDELQRTGIVESVDSFESLLIVERNQNDPNRVDVMASPDLVNQLRILAMLVSFRLQTSTVQASA